MARPRDHAKHVHLAVDDLLRSVTRLVESIGSAVTKDPAVKRAARDVTKSASATSRKIGSKIKASWAKLTSEERKARVEKMHAWRKK